MNTEQEHALLPCPFCGGEPSITKQMGESLWSHDVVLWTQIQCDGCEAHVGPTCEGFEVEAVDIWNRRAALQSQSVIDDDHLSIVLDVYDNAMQKAFDGREFQNPCKPGTPEHKAWEKGSKEGKKKRDAGLPNPIALQSQEREDAGMAEIVREAAQIISAIPPEHAPDNIRWPIVDELEGFASKIGHARRVEGEG